MRAAAKWRMAESATEMPLHARRRKRPQTRCRPGVTGAALGRGMSGLSVAVAVAVAVAEAGVVVAVAVAVVVAEGVAVVVAVAVAVVVAVAGAEVAVAVAVAAKPALPLAVAVAVAAAGDRIEFGIGQQCECRHVCYSLKDYPMVRFCLRSGTKGTGTGCPGPLRLSCRSVIILRLGFGVVKVYFLYPYAHLVELFQC